MVIGSGIMGVLFFLAIGGVVLLGLAATLVHFLAPHEQPSEEERIIASNWSAEIGQQI